MVMSRESEAKYARDVALKESPAGEALVKLICAKSGDFINTLMAETKALGMSPQGALATVTEAICNMAAGFVGVSLDDPDNMRDLTRAMQQQILEGALKVRIMKELDEASSGAANDDNSGSIH